MKTRSKVVVLGINGHIGHYAAKAFAEAGWDVGGFGRSNRNPIAGVRFVEGDGAKLADLRRAVDGADVVVNALNLPYPDWDRGRLEVFYARVLEAMGTSGKTLLFPGNVYNYAGSDRVITPDTRENPETPRGEIRVRVEAAIRAAAQRGDIQAIILRAGDFYAPGSTGDWIEQGVMQAIGKRKIAAPGELADRHTWAYLPDLGMAFEKLAWHRSELGAFESFHFHGHFETNRALLDAVKAASPVPLKETGFPWAMLGAIGLVNPLMREIVKMRYLWRNPMELRDARLDAILGDEFGTPFKTAIAATVAPYFAKAKLAA